MLPFSHADNIVSGVIEISHGTNKVLKCSGEIENNPIVDMAVTAASGMQTKKYQKPPNFNYGFIP